MSLLDILFLFVFPISYLAYLDRYLYQKKESVSYARLLQPLDIDSEIVFEKWEIYYDKFRYWLWKISFKRIKPPCDIRESLPKLAGRKIHSSHRFVSPLKKHVNNTVFFNCENNSEIRSVTVRVILVMEGANVTPISFEEKIIAPEDEAEWEWSVVALKNGLLKYQFVVSEETQFLDERYVQNYTIREWITVPGNIKQDIKLFVQREWKWLFGLFVASGMGWTIIKKFILGLP